MLKTTENINSIVSDIISSIIKDNDDDRETEAMSFRAIVDKHETGFKRDLKKMFRQQEKEVLVKLGVTKDLTDLYIFDLNIWVPTFREVGYKYMEKASNDNGIRVWGDLPLFDKTIKDIIGAVDFDMNYPEAILRLENQAIVFAQSVNETTELAVREAIKAGFTEGLTVIDVAKKVNVVFDNASKVRALMVSRTEMSRAANYGALSAYKQSGVVEAKEWLTAQDERVCPYCYSMDAEVKSLNENFLNNNSALEVNALGEDGKPIPDKFVTMQNNYMAVEAPPLHARCRCTLLPVLREL